MTEQAHSPTALLARRLAAAPQATAFIEGERAFSVAEFDDLVARTQAWLAAQGVAEGDVVALWLVNRLDWLAMYFALCRLGAAVMTVNTRYRGPEVAYLLERSRPKLLVLQQHFRRIDFPAVLQEVDPASAASVQHVVVVDAPSDAALPATVLGHPTLRFALHELPAAPTDMPALDRPDRPSIMFTTSGTTSGPKLVVHTQRTVASHVQAIGPVTGMDAPDAALLAALPFAGVFGFVSMLAALVAGCPVVVHATWDAAEAAAAVPQHRITHLFGSDEMFEGLLQHAPDAAAVPAFPTLRLCGFAAFRAGAEGVARQAVVRGVPMAGLYGMSEVHALFGIQRLDRPLAERLEGGGSLVHPQAQVRARDAETGALLPAGQVGLLELRSPANCIGYLNNPEATAAAIGDDGWFRTGDIGYVRTDGSFVYQTRAGDAIRLAGYLVAPAEIEEVIKAVPGIAAAQVVAVDLAGKTRAVAFVIPAPGAAVSAEAVIAQVAAQMAGYKVPARVWAVDAFPVVLSANGTKIQRVKLREMAEQRLAQEAPAT